MPLRATEPEEAQGLDVVYHGEEAYPTGEGAILVIARRRTDAPAAVEGSLAGLEVTYRAQPPPRPVEGEDQRDAVACSWAMKVAVAAKCA